MTKKRKSGSTDQLPLAPPASELRVLSVQIKNILGLTEKSLDADGRTVVITGPNASGKSSLLQAVQAGLGGGSLAKLARVGAEEAPEIVLVLGGNGDEYRVEKRGDETARVLKRVGDSQAFADVTRPQQFLNGLLDTRLSNPVAWLMAKPKDQAILLLEALPLEMDEAALAELLAEVKAHLRPVPAGLHPLEHLAMLRDHLFSARTGVNRDAMSKRQAAEQLRRQLPAKGPKGVGSALQDTQQEISALAAEIAREEERWGATVQQRWASHEKWAAALRAETEKKIADERAVVEEELAKGAREAEAARKKAHEALSQARERLAQLREQAEEAARHEALDEQAGGFEAEAERHKAESARLTAAMERLDAFRRALAKDLPIPGLEIEGSEIRLDGVPLHQVNASRRVEVAAMVATARAERNPLKVLFLDGLEGLDSEHREALLSYLVEHGVQAFGAVVTDGEPEVRYVGAVTEEARA